MSVNASNKIIKHRGGNQGAESLSNFPEVTQLISSRALDFETRQPGIIMNYNVNDNVHMLSTQNVSGTEVKTTPCPLFLKIIL